jgi:glutamate---cysteine ligase / carboxylate-amine ligase
MILDAETLEPRPAVEELLRAAEELDYPGLLKTELHASVVELNSGVCESPAEAYERLAALRRAAAEAADRIGMRIAAAGSHPSADPESLVVVEKPRYRGFLEYAGVSARRQGVNGLHVHVGVADGDECLKALEGVLPWLPLVLAQSANSPFLAGRETGLMSNRAEVLAELPRSGAPPAFRSFVEWEDFVERFRDSGIPLGRDYTSFWWDVRPHPRFGTLEIRMADQPTSLALTGAFTSLLQALCRRAVQEPAREHAPWERGVYQQNRWAASRFGAQALLIHPDESRSATVQELTRELLESVGGSELLEALDPSTCEAERQVEVGHANGLRAVARDLAERSLEFD